MLVRGKKVEIAENSWIDDSALVEIGDYSYIGGMVRIYRHHHDENKILWNPEREHVMKVVPLTIGSHVFIGYETLVLPSCRNIGDNSVIGARSVLTKDVGDNEIWAGNPAKFIRKRNIVEGVDTLA